MTSDDYVRLSVQYAKLAQEHRGNGPEVRRLLTLSYEMLTVALAVGREELADMSGDLW